LSPLADAAARELARREFERPVVVEAGAGTGKTRTLVARLGTWLLGPGWSAAEAELAADRAARVAAAPTPDEIASRACEGVVAITFTEAAAAEMASRVDRLLGQAAAGAAITDLDEPPDGVAPDDATGRAEALLAAASRLRISTIHGFCHRLLAESPLEAGLHPGFEVDAEGERTVELATEVLLERLRRRDEPLVALLARGVDPPDLLAGLELLVATGVTPEELAGDPFDEATLRASYAALATALDALFAAAAPLRSGHRIAGILDGLAALDRLRAALERIEPSVAGFAQLREELDLSADDARKILGEWGRGNFGKTEEKLLGAIPSELRAAAAELARQHAALAELDPELHTAARRALAAPLAELTARRRAAGVVSFDDLLARAVRLLGERRDVRDRVRRGIRQLLVDEFQDTDRRQCDLLRRLVLDDSPAPRPGLFVVGDPKQSIYGWRSADLAAYEELLAELAAAGGVFCQLEINFRSAPPVLAEVERALAPVLVAQPGIQAAFEPLRASPERSGTPGFVAAGRSPVEYWASWAAEELAGGKATSAASAGELEARAIAADVRALVDAGEARWRDFALLLRARGDLELYLDALRRAGVPYVVQKDRSYYRRREVVDTVAAVRAILDPPDLLALVAFLRSPFVGVPDAAWLPLWRAGFPAAMIALVGEHGLVEALDCVRRAAAEPVAGAPATPRAADWEASLLAAVEAIARLRDEFPRLPTSVWIERLRARLVLEPIAAARFLGRFGLANLERLFAELERRLADEPDPARALAALRRAIAEETPAEEARPPELDDDAMPVMTIHTAKGLEFRHVYLAQAHRRPGGPAAGALPALAVGPSATPREMVLFGAPTPGWRDVEARRRRVAAAESGRLLYVATTRAIDRLVICGRWRPGDDGEPGGSGVPTFADLLAPRVAAAPRPTLDEPLHRDEHGALWRLADGEGEPPALRTDSAHGTTAIPTPEVSTRRRAARERAGRPRLCAASALANGEAHPETETGQGTRLSDEADRGPALARARGVALHRALELHELADSDIEAWRDRLREAFLDEAPNVDAGEVETILAAAEALRSTLLWKQLSRLASRQGVVARELPLLLRAERDDPASPTDGYVGTLDMLYRDGEDGRLVVADFKSDALDEEGVSEVVERYRPQLELYGRAVREALGLATAPRLELWLLALDRIAEIPPTGEADDSG
jgi:ATP-dependent helicase/nuclease subunit A